MRPDQRWFPTNRTERAAWFRNFADQFSQLGISLGFTQNDIDAVNADNTVLQFTAAAMTRLNAEMRAVREFEQLTTAGANNGSQPNFPAFEIVPPPPMVTAGIFARLENIVRRIRVAPGYTTSIGSLLRIIPTNQRAERPDNFVPTLKVWPDASPYTFWVKCSKRMFTGFEVSYKRSGSAEWEGQTTFAASPANVTIAPTTPGLPEKLEIKVRMIKGNYPVTNFSAISTVIVNP